MRRDRSHPRIQRQPRSVVPRLEQLEDRITPTGSSITTLASFGGTSPFPPIGGLVMDSNSNLYGVTRLGGSSNYGAIYEVANGSDTITTLASFDKNSGTPDAGPIVDNNGNLFGTTPAMLFELGKGSSTITKLASFNSTTGYPNANLVMDSSGNLFGITSDGGASGEGSIFELAKGSSTITTLASFTGLISPKPNSLIMDSSGNLYGTTVLGGPTSDGTIFELGKGSSTITTLATFNGGTNGGGPGSLMMDSNGNLFGTAETLAGGLLFELANGSSTITVLASFNGTNGDGPTGSLALDSSGDLFGTTQIGGPSNDGEIYELAHGSSTVAPLASFNGTNGELPVAGLIMDSSGNLYGTTTEEGAHLFGTVYELPAVAPGPILAFVQQPGNTTAGTTMTSITVALEDKYGNIETSDNSDQITLALGAGSPSGALNGKITLTVSGGEATFNDLSIEQAGAGFTLSASTNAAGVISGTSNSFDITPAAVDHLAFLQGPTNTAMGAAIKPAMTAALEDKYGNVETGDNSDTITLTLSPSATLNGTSTQTVSGGEATFSDLSISQAANGYTLTASTNAGGIGSLTSDSFNIAPANVNTTAGNAAVVYSSSVQTVTFRANLANASAPGNPVDEGSVTFTVLNGSSVIAKPVQGSVSGGTASADFSLPAGQAAGSYTLAVSYSDSQGNFIDSGDTNGTLSILVAPAVTTNPSDTTVAAGDSAAFTAAADGFPAPTVQWQVSIDGGTTFADINGAASPTLTINATEPSQNGDEYQAVFINSGGMATSQPATLHVLFAPVVATQPSNQTATVGHTATFTVAVNGYPTPAVQWEVRTDGGSTWTSISTATSTTLTLLNVQFAQNGDEYRALLSNGLGSATTTAALLTVQIGPAITSGASAVFAAGHAGSFTVTATGSPAPTLTESGALPSGVAFTDNGNGTATLAGTPAIGTQGTYPFSIVAHNGAGSDVTQNFTLTVKAVPVSPPLAPPPSPHQPPAPHVPPLLALLGGFFAEVETINGDGTETVAYSLFGTTLIVSTYDSSGNFMSASLFGISMPNWVWYL